MDCRSHSDVLQLFSNYIPQIMYHILIKQTVKIGSIGLDECNGKLMEDLKTEILWRNSDFSPKMMKMFYSLVIRQAQ